jgi:hypothetical protein
MRIGGFDVQRCGDRVRMSATMAWEDVDRPSERVFFETEAHPTLRDAPSAEAFLLASLVPAMHYGERRLAVEAAICPVLLEGLATAMPFMHHWHYRDRRQPLVLEVAVEQAAPRGNRRLPAGVFFSGGVDSYAALYSNRLTYPRGHPNAVTAGVLVCGLEMSDADKFAIVRETLAEAAAAVGVGLITVSTNAYLLFRAEDAAAGFRFWELEYEGSLLAAVAHSLADRLSAVTIAGTLSPRVLYPYGSHPLIDPCFTSSVMRVTHGGAGSTRLEKTRALVDWGVPLRYLRVCNLSRHYRCGSLNCGRCNKCVRTKLALLVLGALDETPAFADARLDDVLLRKAVRLKNEYIAACYEELLEPLLVIGRDDLAHVLHSKLIDYRRRGPRPGHGSRPLHERFVRRLRRWWSLRLAAES